MFALASTIPVILSGAVFKAFLPLGAWKVWMTASYENKIRIFLKKNPYLVKFGHWKTYITPNGKNGAGVDHHESEDEKESEELHFDNE